MLMKIINTVGIKGDLSRPVQSNAWVPHDLNQNPSRAAIETDKLVLKCIWKC